MDSVLSILQMPRGVPVATVAINNATNAGLLAVRILGAGAMPHLLDRLSAYMAQSEQDVLRKAEALEAQGWQAYADAAGLKNSTVM